MSACILLLEPDPTLRQFLAAILARAGHEVIETDDVEGALEALQRATVDLVLSDLLGAGRGTAMATQLRQRRPDLEIVSLSDAPESAGYLRLAATLGARRTLAEPFMSRELRALLAEVGAGVSAHRAHVSWLGRRAAAGQQAS